MKKLVTFLKDDSGATAIEYALIVALIAIGIILVMTDAGEQLREVFMMVKEGFMIGLENAT